MHRKATEGGLGPIFKLFISDKILVVIQEFR